jgi:nucleoside-diphosphate-sugar epimerase
LKRVLVTGASGFVGRHTLEPLLRRGFEVHAISARAVRRETSLGVIWHRADLLDCRAVRALIGDVSPEYLLHLAWYMQPGRAWTAAVNFDWVHASMNLLHEFGENGGQRAVLAGSCAEYTWQARTHCVEATTPTAPATFYGMAKHRLHAMASACAKQAGVSLAWARIFFLYGPHEHPERLAAAVARALLRREEVACSDGRQVRDYLYVPELGSALAALLSSDVAGPVNMASGMPVRVADVIAALARASGSPELVRLGARASRPGEPDVLTADIGRLRDEVGWRSSVTLEEGAARTVAWWRSATLDA